MSGHSFVAKSLLFALLTVWTTTVGSAWVSPNPGRRFLSIPFPRQTVVTLRARGKGSLGKELGGGAIGGNKKDSGSGITSKARSSVNWIPLSVSASALPQIEDKVQLIDTNLFTLQNAQTNPTGAVSVLKHRDQTYCFSVNCPSCKIPLTKATVLPAAATNNRTAPRLLCDFCKAEFDLSTGETLESTIETGLLGGIARKVFASQDHGPLKLYKLGEKGGKLLISLD
jgi:nitrite reductase/ring-hydroxylating ferredoxin subunit